MTIENFNKARDILAQLAEFKETLSNLSDFPVHIAEVKKKFFQMKLNYLKKILKHYE